MAEFDLETPSAPAPAAAPPAAPPDPTPQDPPVAAAPEEEALPEGAIEQAGQVMVPLAALKDARAQAKDLKTKAQAVEQVQQWYQQVRPYVDFLQSHPDLLTRGNAPAPTPSAPEHDPAAENLARTLDLYTADGRPDAARAQVLMGVVEQLAEKKASAVVQPVQEQTLQQRSLANFHDAANAKAPNGATVSRDILWQVWSQGDPRVLATTQGAAAAWALALGMQAMQPSSPTQTAPTIQVPGGPPLVTEAPGRPGARPLLTDLDQRVMNVRGIDAKKYAEYAKAFKPGEVNTIEE